MNDHKIPHRQLTAWLAAALIPTVIQITGGTSWLSVLLICAATLPCVWLRWRFGAEPTGKVNAVVQIALLTVVLTTACRASAQSWPSGAPPFIGITLLSLAAWSVSKGISATARVSCVLFWFVLVLYLILLGAGMKDVKPQWLSPGKGDVEAFGCVLLLTPAVAGIHLNKKENLKPRLLLISAFGILAAAITAGVLSPEVAARKENAFYEMSRSLNLLGQARRFEAVLSAGMTAGWFALLSLYLSVCADLSEKLHCGWGKWGSFGAAAVTAGGVLCEVHIPGLLLLVLCAVFWVLIPLLTQGIVIKKKS